MRKFFVRGSLENYNNEVNFIVSEMDYTLSTRIPLLIIPDTHFPPNTYSIFRSHLFNTRNVDGDMLFVSDPSTQAVFMVIEGFREHSEVEFTDETGVKTVVTSDKVTFIKDGIKSEVKPVFSYIINDSKELKFHQTLDNVYGEGYLLKKDGDKVSLPLPDGNKNVEIYVSPIFAEDFIYKERTSSLEVLQEFWNIELRSSKEEKMLIDSLWDKVRPVKYGNIPSTVGKIILLMDWEKFESENWAWNNRRNSFVYTGLLELGCSHISFLTFRDVLWTALHLSWVAPAFIRAHISERLDAVIIVSFGQVTRILFSHASCHCQNEGEPTIWDILKEYPSVGKLFDLLHESGVPYLQDVLQYDEIFDSFGVNNEAEVK